jgi:hypothetical protein
LHSHPCPWARLINAFVLCFCFFYCLLRQKYPYNERESICPCRGIFGRGNFPSFGTAFDFFNRGLQLFLWKRSKMPFFSHFLYVFIEGYFGKYITLIFLHACGCFSERVLAHQFSEQYKTKTIRKRLSNEPLMWCLRGSLSPR